MVYWKALVATSLLTVSMGAAVVAESVTLKFHSFPPMPANSNAKFVKPWADKVTAESNGEITVEMYASMQLGGKPPQLVDQVREGVVDIIWTVAGYTPGRFPHLEAFELPFMPASAEATSQAAHEYMMTIGAEDLKDYKVLAVHVHAPGTIHTKDTLVKSASDLNGLKMRGPTRVISQMLGGLGATPVGMPVPQVAPSLSKGVIDGTTIPWEVTKALKVPELVENHTEFTGPMMYTVTFVLVMNKDKFASLPDDLKAVMEENSGLEFSIFAGTTQQAYDAPARKIAEDRGNTIITLDAAQSAVWAEAAQPVYGAWLEEMTGRGIDGQALIEEATALMNAAN